MIFTRELIVGSSGIIPQEHIENLQNLRLKLNELRKAYGKPLKVTSGYRDLAKHLAIYAAKGITDTKKIPMKSNHLFGLAADLVPVEDSILHLHDWVVNNEEFCEEVGLWFEDPRATAGWLHAQIVPPKSGKRFFLP